MAIKTFDFVIPMYRLRWCTQAVFEGISHHYQPRHIHVIAPEDQANLLSKKAQDWNIGTLYTHPEESFFQSIQLSKETICKELVLGESLYTAGWFYQQLLKLAAYEGIENLSEDYVVWDSDLLAVNTWPLLTKSGRPIFALIQHNLYGNASIVAKWEHWIRTILGVTPLEDVEGTFIPHHMWFNQTHLQSFGQRIQHYFQSEEHWLILMMRSANTFGTFSEFWAYISWVSAQEPKDILFHPYSTYGISTERFFDDGTGLFTAKFRQFTYSTNEYSSEFFSPSYKNIISFIKNEYEGNPLPSSLSFESSSRHLKKGNQNRHIEETRSRWNLTAEM